jgi:NADH-quinone oxidoreductase subunit L
VIIALHHEQDMRRMGALWKRMPVTYLTALIGSLALVGIPPFAGFFSKDAIIEAVALSHTPAAKFVYVVVVVGVFLTALYSFRMIFMVFHGPSRLSEDNRKHAHESPWVVTVPLILLAIPSVLAGLVLVGPALSGHLFGDSIMSVDSHGAGSHSGADMLAHAWISLPLWLAVAGIAAAWFLYLHRPQAAAIIANRFRLLHQILLRKYGVDELYLRVFADGGQGLGRAFWKFGDRLIIDDTLVNGTAKWVGRLSGVIRSLQTGYVYHYAFAMIIGLVVLMSWFLWT